MTKDEARKLSEVYGWIADGKAVQFLGEYGEWHDHDGLIDGISGRSAAKTEWRLKPEPREWWIRTEDGGDIRQTKPKWPVGWIRVREVIEGDSDE